jgi:hypothetical protein
VGFPQFGHGSIKLTVLFNNPADIEFAEDDQARELRARFYRWNAEFNRTLTA